jgi:hypothetical protein
MPADASAETPRTQEPLVFFGRWSEVETHSIPGWSFTLMEDTMRNLFTTTALIAPLLVGTALAQTPPPTTQPAEPTTDTEAESTTEPTTEPTTEAPTDEEPAEEEPAEEAPESTPDTEAAPVPDTSATEAEPRDVTETDSETIVREQAQNELRVDWITGSRVRAPDDENIGRIHDLIIDQDTHTITAAILSVGGFLGIGAKQIAVRFDELEIDFDAREIRLNLSREEADAAPEYVYRDRTDLPVEAPAMGDTGAPALGAPATGAPETGAPAAPQD